TYDDANRHSTLTYPNGIVATYGYDNANELTSLAYTLGPTTLGSLTYTYDAAGQRTSIGGSWASTGLSQALASATYDGSNRLVTWGGQIFSYDSNGNSGSDGPTSYLWNARDQLIGLSGGVSASFAYDGTGRSRGKTVAGTTTNFLYDGPNFVQELTGANAQVANLLGGFGMDETFTRTDASGTRTFLGDLQGSTLALSDTAGTTQTQHTYEPFGATTTSGVGNTNASQFTGRENDSAGLYFLRARFYNPLNARFVSEDAIGFGGGQANLYGYVGNSPVNAVDGNGRSVNYVHWWETYNNAASAIGLSPSDAWDLARRVANVDDEPGTQGCDAQSASRHGMASDCPGRKDPPDPCDAWRRTIDQMHGDLFHALHAIQDAWVHHYAPWNGGRPIPLTSRVWPGWGHFYRDLWYNPDAEAATEAYLRSLGPGLNPTAFLPPPPSSCQ